MKAIVGLLIAGWMISGCVAGSTIPMTPHGARSIRQSPVESVRASERIDSTPSTFFTISSFWTL